MSNVVTELEIVLYDGKEASVGSVMLFLSYCVCFWHRASCPYVALVTFVVAIGGQCLWLKPTEPTEKGWLALWWS